jgi:bifunctional DNA-binding transcriptional regulator/antitoxin component of YhaV-PrlF toxin-antitoxin module
LLDFLQSKSRASNSVLYRGFCLNYIFCDIIYFASYANARLSRAVLKLTNNASYSFSAKIKSDGSIYIPKDILEELNLEKDINVRIRPNMKEIITVQSDDFDLSFWVFRNKLQIYKKLKKTIAIDEDCLFLLDHFSAPYIEKHNFIDITRLLALLITLYGEPDTFYDDFKCSFNYTFDFKIVYKNENPAREVNLVMRINDLKGNLNVEFRRLRENKNDNEIKLIEDVVKRDDLNMCILLLHSYFSGFYYGYGTRYLETFERYQPYCKVKYGFDGNEFYYIQEEEDPSFD